MGQRFKMTDKALTKIVPCTYPGCDNELEVTTFYAPAKARCPDHSGRRVPPELAQTASPEVAGPPTGALTNLACPVHTDTRMVVLSTSSPRKEGLSLQLQCPTCFIVVEIDTVMNKMLKPKEVVGDKHWPTWDAFVKGRICACGHRIAAYKGEDDMAIASRKAGRNAT